MIWTDESLGTSLCMVLSGVTFVFMSVMTATRGVYLSFLVIPQDLEYVLAFGFVSAFSAATWFVAWKFVRRDAAVKSRRLRWGRLVILGVILLGWWDWGFGF